MHDAESGTQRLRQLHAVPQREGVAWYQSHLRACACRRGGAGDASDLVCKAARDLPATGRRTGDTGFPPKSALRTGLDDDRGVVRIGGAGVGAIEPIHGRREGEVVSHIPLHTDFTIGELLGLESLSGRGERCELVAAAGQVRNAVAAVYRYRLHGFDDESCAW